MLPECAESACSYAPVCKIDVSVDHISDQVPDCFFAKAVSEGKEKRRLIVEIERIVQRGFSSPSAAMDILLNAA